MQPLLVADIGGTNARFALALGQTCRTIQLSNQLELSCASFSSFSDALSEYLSALPEKNIKRASIAIAGPITDEFVKMTNLDWELAIDKIKKQFGFVSVFFVNDLAAHALATISLEASNFETIKPGNVQAKAARAIIGPGTGLGVASLNWHSNSWRAFPTEGGHIAFAPSNNIEHEIHKMLYEKHGYVSLEMLLSGPGLLNIYQALGQIQGQDIIYKDSKSILKQTGDDALCLNSVEVFVSILGSAAGDLALAYGAKGGVYLGGGMSKHLLPYIRKPSFVEQFLQKGFRREYLTSIPIDAILYPSPGLLGAALWYYQHNKIQEAVSE